MSRCYACSQENCDYRKPSCACSCHIDLDVTKKNLRKPTTSWWDNNRPEIMWVLIDKSNSNENSKNYLWWFETKVLAITFLKEHKKYPNTKADLVGPFKYVLKKDK